MASFLVLPDLHVSHFVVALPIQIDNTGKAAIRSPRLQVRNDPRASVLVLNKPEIDIYRSFLKDSAIRRSDIVVGETALSDYELDVLRREESALVGHLVAIPRQLVFQDPSAPWLCRIHMQVTSENADLGLAEAYFIVGTTQEGETEELALQRLSEVLLQQLVADEHVKTQWVFRWRKPFRPLATFACVEIHPRFTVSLERVGFEDSLRRGQPTRYRHGEVHLTDMSEYAVRRRRLLMSRDP
jgi:hypothetical protein